MHRKLAIQGSTQAYACRYRLLKRVLWRKVAKSLLMPLFLFSNTAVAEVDVNESLFGLQQLRLFVNSPDGYVPISQPAALAELMGEEQVDSLTLEDARRKAHESSYSLGASRSKTSAAANLARAAYSPQVFLLDEPTAGVDGETEAKLVDAVDQLTRGKTVILATHSLALLKKMDRIVVLERGKVVASGSPERLLQPATGQA
ncbi:AAA family ATPase [Methylovorus sp. SPW-M1]